MLLLKHVTSSCPRERCDQCELACAGLQTTFQWLSFFNNSLNGNVSSAFCNMPSLAYLDLRANVFSGEAVET